MKKILVCILVLGFVGCGGESGPAPGPKPPGSSPTKPTPTVGECQPKVSVGMNNLEIARAFNEWRIRCNPNLAYVEAQAMKWDRVLK